MGSVADQEMQNERRVVNWLGAIAVTAIVAAAYLVASSQRTKFGIDTAVVVAFVTIAGTCASSLGTRRTRTTDAEPPPEGTPPPWTPTPPTATPPPWSPPTPPPSPT